MVRHKQNRKSERARRPGRARPSRVEERKSGKGNLSELNIPAARFQRLSQAIAAAPPNPTTLSHEECEALLEFYVDDEKQDLFPSVRQHLQECGRCRLSYSLLVEALEVNKNSAIEMRPEPMPALSFLPPASDAAWTKYYQPRTKGAAMAFGFAIRPSYLQQVFVSPSFATRGEQTSERSLLLSDTFSFADRQIDVEIWAQRDGDASHLKLDIFLVSSVPLPAPLQVVLKWDEQRVSLPIEKGRATIERLALSELGKAGDLRVELVTDDQA
jgi:hypothetical protein